MELLIGTEGRAFQAGAAPLRCRLTRAFAAPQWPPANDASRLRPRRRVLLAGSLLLFLAFGLCRPAPAADLKVEAKLIWGTNDEHYNNPDKHTRVDEPTAEKFRRTFKWKYYYVVNQQATNVPSRQTKRVKMSNPCSIDITELPGDRVEVTLIGQGKPVNKTVQPLKKGELLVIAGGDKNDSAWFVVVTQLE
jgi:hypothetical protein